MIHLQFFAQGEPKGQPRPKARAFAGHAQVYNPKTADLWKCMVVEEAKKHQLPAPITGPVRFSLVLYFPRPLGHYRKDGTLKESAPAYCAQKPDFDNAAKSTVDALGMCGFWMDDKQIVDAHVVKKYVQGKTYAPGAMIEIREAVL